MSDTKYGALTVIKATDVGYYVVEGGLDNGYCQMIIAAFSSLDHAVTYIKDRMR